MRSAQQFIVLAFSVVLSLANVDRILKTLGEAVDELAPPEEAAKYKVDVRGIEII